MQSDIDLGRECFPTNYAADIVSNIFVLIASSYGAKFYTPPPPPGGVWKRGVL